jgi:hypothetical protein
MPTGDESRCCNEYDEYRKQFAELPEDQHTPVNCITQHAGFQPVCLNVWVLQAAYKSYKQRHGNLLASQNEYVSMHSYSVLLL